MRNVTPVDLSADFPQLGQGEIYIAQDNYYEILTFRTTDGDTFPLGNRTQPTHAFRVVNTHGSTGLAEALAAAGLGTVEAECDRFAYLVLK